MQCNILIISVFYYLFIFFAQNYTFNTQHYTDTLFRCSILTCRLNIFFICSILMLASAESTKHIFFLWCSGDQNYLKHLNVFFFFYIYSLAKHITHKSYVINKYEH